ncbi:DUF333 domain-containing protein [Magnetovibrio sp. PR-2]|uniref:putative hemolysin n=1 Tax=Magnetovibrio sp. PR-2 TaxID=3120356 RepID=UPI002FCE157F
MTRLSLRYILALILLWSAPALSSDVGLFEANARFTYQDQPIHPTLIKAFQNWSADYRPPMTVTMDVGAAFESNQFGGAVNVNEDGWVSVASEDTGRYAYRHLGRVANDIHVLHTQDKPAGGTGIFQTLTFVRFHTDQLYDRDGLKPSKRLLMSIVRLYPLFGAKAPRIDITEDRVRVGEGGNIVTLKFASSPIGMANPASMNCAKLGGKTETKTTDKDEVTLCHLPNGAICEEWSLFRGECS